MWSTRVLEYYPAVKKNKVLTCATTWLKPEDAMLSEKVRKGQILYYSTYLGPPE